MKLYSSDGGMFIIGAIIWVFLVDGDPDVWDRLHAWFMSITPIQ